MKLQIQNKQRKFSVSKEIKEGIKKIILSALEEEGISFSVEISMVLINNPDIRKLNKEYRAIDKETDVLSFPIYTKREIKSLVQKPKTHGKEVILLGDIIISLEKVQEQSIEYGHSFERELNYLIIHGILHLLGYDHIKKSDKQKMREKEELILQRNGYERDGGGTVEK